MQKRLGETFIDFRAQARDMYVNDVGLWVEMVVPHVFQQHCAGDHLSSMLHQIFQQPKFTWLQRDFLVSTTHLVGQAVEFEITNPKHSVLGPADTAARKRFDSGEQLRK
jgi:hypothetical protein